MPDAPAIAPYSLIAETERAAEILVLTYTAALEFFERFAPSAARATQARVTVIADATMVSVDPGVVRAAGRTSLDARAVCPANTAFHPKLLVIAGAEHATVAVGSGNLTARRCGASRPVAPASSRASVRPIRPAPRIPTTIRAG